MIDVSVPERWAAFLVCIVVAGAVSASFKIVAPDWLEGAVVTIFFMYSSFAVYNRLRRDGYL